MAELKERLPPVVPQPLTRLMHSFLVKPVLRWRDRFLSTTIATRMTLAYLPLAVIIVFMSIYTLYSLNALSDISRSIVENNMVVIETADNLRDSLLAQESYGRRFLIMKSRQMKDLFWQRDEEFTAALDRLRQVEELESRFRGDLRSLHDTFNRVYREVFELAGGSALAEEKGQHEERISRTLDEQLALIQQMEREARQNLGQKSQRTGAFSAKAFHITAFLSILGIGLGITAAFLITRNVSRSLKQLKLATAKFSERKFDFVPNLKQGDEFGRLAQSFTAMAQRLARLEVMDLDASPLTRLPGGLAIENVLKERLSAGGGVAFCLLDIDNFKSFNDRYGYTRGNEVIKATGKIIESAIARHGKEDAFLGHIGGDDFAVIVRPETYIPICEYIIDAFDNKVLEFYDAEDCARGYITAKNRQGKTEQFPLMTVSIAVVTNDNREELNSIRIGEIAAEVKEHAKSMNGSVYLIDRRVDDVLLS